MKKHNKKGIVVLVFFTILLVYSCGRGKKCTKAKEGTTTEIKQGSENQALEDSIKREKNKLKK